MTSKVPRLIDIPSTHGESAPIPIASLLEHFTNTLSYQDTFHERNIEFLCKKGGYHNSLNTEGYMTKKQNQDNFFCVTDNELKIFGVFDGHGEYGHLVSSYA